MKVKWTKKKKRNMLCGNMLCVIWTKTKKHALCYLRAKCSPTSLVEIFLANPQSKGYFNNTIYFRKKKKIQIFINLFPYLFHYKFGGIFS